MGMVRSHLVQDLLRRVIAAVVVSVGCVGAAIADYHIGFTQQVEFTIRPGAESCLSRRSGYVENGEYHCVSDSWTQPQEPLSWWSTPVLHSDEGPPKLIELVKVCGRNDPSTCAGE